MKWVLERVNDNSKYVGVFSLYYLIAGWKDMLLYGFFLLFCFVVRPSPKTNACLISIRCKIVQTDL